VTGHQSLIDSEGWDWVTVVMENLLTELPPPLIGVTCLAVGADSLFARVVLKHNGSIEAVLPFPDYERKLQDDERHEHRRLLDRASLVTTLQRCGTDEECYFEAGKRVVDLADLVIAVWDGKPAKGLGGTADIFEYARAKRKAIVHLDPVRQRVDRPQFLDCLDTSKNISPHPFF
jgi:hypothetical protein